MELKIITMTIQNFKGIKSFGLDFDGKGYNIFGDNKTGKTTIFDAFVWTLFGKDSLGQANFEIKPLRKDGSVINNLETVVEILFEKDGQDFLLKRLYREIWRGKRGGTETELTGHETLTYINEEKVGVKEYERFIGELIDEELFKILTNVYYFNQLHHTKQREILFKLVEGMTDEVIIDADETLAPLKEHLPDGRTVEALAKILKDKIKQTQSQLDDYPIRIGVLKDISYQIQDDYSDPENDEKLAAAYNRQSELEKSKATGSNSAKIAELEIAIRSYEKEIGDLELKREKLSNDAEKEKMGKILAENTELNKLREKLQKAEIELNNYQIRLKNGSATIEEEKTKRKEIYDAYPIERDKVFTPEACPYCGHDLPKEMADEHEKKFNLEKATRLAEMKEKGEAITANIEKYLKAVINFESQIAMLESQIASLKVEITEKEKEIDKAKKEPSAVDDSEIVAQIEKANERKAVIEKELEKVKSKIQPTLFDGELAEVKARIEKLVANRTEYRIREENEKRITELEREQKDARKKYEEYMKILELCERFIVAKRDVYQEEIDAYFKIVKFKLFEVHISGGVREICVASVDGVPYPSLNSGAKINAGLDIIKTLQKVYGVKVPIFIDNAESTTKYVPLDSQIIKLYVSEKDKKLRFVAAGETVPIIQPEIEFEEREEI